MNILINFFLLIIAVVGVSKGRPSFWDSVPAVSQAKMLVLYVIGDHNQAEQVWKNFKNMTHLWDNVKHIDDSVPVYGHIKGIIVGLEGHEERASEIFESVHKSTSIIGGGMLGGPAGGVIGAILADATMSIAEHKPVGVIDYTLHYSNSSSGDTIDVILDLTLAGVSNINGKQVNSETLENFKYSIPIKLKKGSALPKQLGDYYGYNNGAAPLATPEIFKIVDGLQEKLGKRGSTLSDRVKETGGTAGHMVHPHDSAHAPVPAVNLKKGSDKDTDKLE